ncbi:MAG: hypothetical protein A2Y17_07715 [Clostridiales bacterium GWF2_38_85]|nr:MAG: hypothetical protein A2Y17_07715 [Clostridiales bacterium GWF2_38_85]HBL84238.1 EamA/RhaT family transporter [Clostridiales bacterium]
MKKKNNKFIIFAILAAALYAINIPFSKLLLTKISGTMMAALLYLGAGIGMFIVGFLSKKHSFFNRNQYPTRQQLKYVIGMIIFDIAAPICLMFGLKYSLVANAALLNNFEIVATSIIALLLFKETISKRLWMAITLITLSGIILSFKDMNNLTFSTGSLLIIVACICWGFENNCTHMLSDKNPLIIVIIKGIASGTGSMLVSFLIIDFKVEFLYVIAAAILGFLSYGMSIYFYVYAQRKLGATKTSAFYAVSPFIGTILSLIIFKEIPTLNFFVAVLIMGVGTYFVIHDKPNKKNNIKLNL